MQLDSRVFDVQRCERYQAVQRFAWGINVELFDDSRVLKARLRERLRFGRSFDLTLFDHAEVPRLTSTIEFGLWPRVEFSLSDDRSVSVRGDANAIAVRCGAMALELEFFGALTEERHWDYGHLKGSNVEDEALAMALVLPVLATQPSDWNARSASRGLQVGFARPASWLRETCKSVRETCKLVRETCKLVRETCKLVRETCKLMRKTCKLVRERCKSMRERCMTLRGGCQEFGVRTGAAELVPLGASRA